MIEGKEWPSTRPIPSFDLEPVKSAATGTYLVHQKTLDASGVVDDGEVLKVDMSKLPLVLGTTTVTIRY